MATKKVTTEAAETLAPESEQAVSASAPQETGQIGKSETLSAQNAGDSKRRTEKTSSSLESLSALAERHRVPSWQQAALCRFMGWVDGKMLTDAEYTSALAKLSARHLGGGRRM